MMRCVLNYFPGSSKSNGQNKAILVSKADFQQRLRLVKKRYRWRMTRTLLFGGDSYDNRVMEDFCGRGNEQEQQQQQHWWESGCLRDEDAPGLAEAIRGYRDSLRDDPPPGFRAIDEDKEDPTKFLSRLARGRTYKGNFRSLLEDYVAATCGEDDERLIPLYDKIYGSKKANSKCNGDTDRDELKILRLFIDELEEDAAGEAATGKYGREYDGTHPTPTAEPSMVSSEMISLLRAICELDIFSFPQTKLASNGFDTSAFDDGGRSVGKRVERNLETFLVEKENAGGTALSASELFSFSPDRTKVMSPVWVRPKDKNRRSAKEKCRYVLEIPRMPRAGSKSQNSKSANGFVSPGTTSEFDAMVVRIIGGNNTAHHQKDEGLLWPRPVMAIREVWDAKATLDPSALIDVLDKKAGSLQKILSHENCNVVNLADTTAMLKEGNESTMVAGNDRGGDNEGANFVVLPSNGNTDTSVSGGLLPMVYRVGIEPPSNTGETNDNGNNRGDLKFCEGLPQIGVFASKMIHPGAAARRIQTIIYERMLETDFATVKDVVLRHCHSEDDASPDVEEPAMEGNWNSKGEDGALRCNRLVREGSLEIVERILRLIEIQKPIVVVETLPSNG
jgi:hypothetical protein